MVKRRAAEATAQVLEWRNGWKRKKKTNPDDAQCLPQALDVVPASAPGELFSVIACNYTGPTARGAMEVAVR